MPLATGSSRFSACRLAAALVLGLTGCNSTEPMGVVTGRVTFEGQPVEEGMVCFANREKGVSIAARQNSGGTFQVEMAQGVGLPVGDYEVWITPPRTEVSLDQARTPLDYGKPPQPGQLYRNIPDQYRTAK